MAPADSSRYLLPEQKARQRIDAMLEAAGWIVQDYQAVNLYAGKGVAVREVPTEAGSADYVLFINAQPVGVIEAKKSGTTLSGVEWQTAKYQSSFPTALFPVLVNGRLPFGYESTGEETWFTCWMDPEPTARRTFWFHRPETFERDLDRHVDQLGGSLRARIQEVPDLDSETPWLRTAQAKAIRSLEVSLKQHQPRALIQMATGSGKTFCAANICERLIKHANARRILFLVDRSNLGKQTLKEFQGFDIPGRGRKFSEDYIVDHLTHNHMDQAASVCIATIQRVYSMLRGEPDLDESAEEASGFDNGPSQPVSVDYNPDIPIEHFDVIIIDECHRSIYGVWRQVLEYFDAFLIGLTATPGKQTLGFFNQNLVMEYGYPEAVADKVNVDFDVFRLSTAITESGSTIRAGYWTAFRDRETRTERQELVDEDLTYQAAELDKRVVAKDQIRTIGNEIRDLLPAMFPDREIDEHGRLCNIPKTLVFAKDDSHAEDIVRIFREVFGKGNQAIAKITYRSSDGRKPEELLRAFKTTYYPRIAVTVDMIATGTDVKPLEMVVFMRMVRSRTYFEQMKGRGVRTISDDDLKGVTPDANGKDRFVLVDAVGVTETKLIETTPLERKRGVSLMQLLQQVSMGGVSEDAVSSLASRLARIDRRIGPVDRAKIEEAAGESLAAITHRLVDALDPDKHVQAAVAATGDLNPPADAIAKTRDKAFVGAVKPIAAKPELRELLVNIQRHMEQVIDEISADRVIRAEFVIDARARAQGTVESWRQFIDDNKDEITALQVFYSKPYAQRLTYRDIKELAEAIKRPPHNWTPERIWEAYETLDATKVRGSASNVLTNIVSLVRFTLELDDELAPFTDKVNDRFDAWLFQQENAGRQFTDEQRQWLADIRDHIAASLSITTADLMDSPFNRRGGLGKARTLFGEDLEPLLTELSEFLAA